MNVGFQRTHLYERRAPLREIQADLAEIGRYNTHLESQIRVLERGLSGGGLLTLGAMLTLFATFAYASVVPQPGGGNFSPAVRALFMMECLTVVLGIVVVVVCGVFAEFVRGRKIEMRRLNTAVELLRHVGRDVRPDRPLSAAVDFRPTHKLDFLRVRESVGNATRLKYTQRWLDVRGRLVDRTRFLLTATQHLKRKQVKKRRVRDRDALRETATLILWQGGAPRPSLSFAPRLLARRWRGRASLANTDVRAGGFRATIVSPVDTNDTLAPNSYLGEKLLDHHQLLALFLACVQVWRMVRRPAPN